ncbi:hypothetical protein P7L75_09475 [Tistrella mobilis]|uniref:hypothetical protein n=1 Tax=Tistrella mobilis TaxID=171437 RepID=UPI003556D02E
MSALDPARLTAIEQRLAALEAARPVPEPAACVTEDAIADADATESRGGAARNPERVR